MILGDLRDLRETIVTLMNGSLAARLEKPSFMQVFNGLLANVFELFYMLTRLNSSNNNKINQAYQLEKVVGSGTKASRSNVTYGERTRAA